MASIEPSKPSLNPGRWHRPYSWITASVIIQLTLSPLVIIGYIKFHEHINSVDIPSGMMGAIAGIYHLFIAIPALFAAFLLLSGAVTLLIFETKKGNTFRKVRKIGAKLSVAGLVLLLLTFYSSVNLTELFKDIIEERALVTLGSNELGILDLSVTIAYVVILAISLWTLRKGWEVLAT